VFKIDIDSPVQCAYNTNRYTWTCISQLRSIAFCITISHHNVLIQWYVANKLIVHHTSLDYEKDFEQ